MRISATKTKEEMISLIHPSRGRPEKSFHTCSRWVERSGHPDIQLVVSFDSDDPCRGQYVRNCAVLQRKIDTHKAMFPIGVYNEETTRPLSCFGISHGNSSVVEATNMAVRQAHGDIFIYLSDDFDCPENWADAVIREFDGATGPRLVKVDDCLQPFHVRVLTIPIMNRALYERLGYFFNPQYKSMFVDEDLWHTANRLGALWSAPHLKFEHKHVSVGKAEDDETYRRSSANWNQGKEVFNRRKRMGFPV